MLNREVNALCPKCNKQVKGGIYEENGKVFLRKECAEDGVVVDMLSSNAQLFRDRMSLLDHAAPNKCSMEKCSRGIFKCADHVSKKSPLAFIEITTNCNMRCPVCYADAAGKGRDMPFEDVCRIIDTIADMDKSTHVILIGGEPTIHKDFFRILEKLQSKGLMKRTFIATNGITLSDKEFCKKVQLAGIKKFYLGFDGTDREACKEIRGTYLAYDSVRKALQNIRENGKAWIILSITAVRDLNVEDIPSAIEFALDNSDIVKRIMVSPEVYCGRINENDDLSENRLTGDCIEDYLRDNLGIKVATVSISLFFTLIRPLKSMGLLDADSWMAGMPSPFCGQMGLLWKKDDGKYFSVVDFFVKNADEKVYALGRHAGKFAEKVDRVKTRLAGTLAGRILWKALVYLYFIPVYFFMIFAYLNKGNLFSALGELIKAGFTMKKFKAEFFGRKIELFYLLGSDKFNYIWDKMPYCLTHHYRIHPETNEVIKLPGCFVFSFREELEKTAAK